MFVVARQFRFIYKYNYLFRRIFINNPHWLLGRSVITIFLLLLIFSRYYNDNKKNYLPFARPKLKTKTKNWRHERELCRGKPKTILSWKSSVYFFTEVLWFNATQHARLHVPGLHVTHGKWESPRLCYLYYLSFIFSPRSVFFNSETLSFKFKVSLYKLQTRYVLLVPV